MTVAEAEQRHWIAFDAVGTLIFADPPVHLAYHRIGQAHGSQLSPGDVRVRFQSAFASRAVGRPDAAPRATSESEERRFWHSLVADVLPDVVDANACFDELFDHFAAPSSWQCFADVEETVSILRERGFGLALASNFDSRLHAVRAGLPELLAFDAAIVSSEVGYAKPAQQFIDALIRFCACPGENIVFVGDDVVTDVAGARQAGLHAVHLDRTARSDSSHSIQTLAELPALLQEF